MHDFPVPSEAERALLHVEKATQCLRSLGEEILTQVQFLETYVPLVRELLQQRELGLRDAEHHLEQLNLLSAQVQAIQHQLNTALAATPSPAPRG